MLQTMMQMQILLTAVCAEYSVYKQFQLVIQGIKYLNLNFFCAYILKVQVIKTLKLELFLSFNADKK